MSIVSVNNYWENETKKTKSDISIQYATVIEFTLQGEPILQFMGDKLPSQRIYKAAMHVVGLEKGDRVRIFDGIIDMGLRR